MINYTLSYTRSLYIFSDSLAKPNYSILPKFFSEIPLVLEDYICGAQLGSEFASVQEWADLHQQVAIETHPQGLAAENAS